MESRPDFASPQPAKLCCREARDPSISPAARFCPRCRCSSGRHFKNERASMRETIRWVVSEYDARHIDLLTVVGKSEPDGGKLLRDRTQRCRHHGRHTYCSAISRELIRFRYDRIHTCELEYSVRNCFRLPAWLP